MFAQIRQLANIEALSEYAAFPGAAGWDVLVDAWA